MVVLQVNKTQVWSPTNSGNTVTVDSKGRIVLPQGIRERLGIEPGTEVEVHEEGGKAVGEPEDDRERDSEQREQLMSDAANGSDAAGEEMGPVAEYHTETIRGQATRNADE